MEARLDTGFESWGMFGENADSLLIPGRLVYSPSNGLALELIENRTGAAAAAVVGLPSLSVIYGRLIDGTLITLIDCITTKTSLGAGGVGLPTALVADRGILGGHVADLDSLAVKSLTVELSSLSNWTCVRPAKPDIAPNGGCVSIHFVRPDPICVMLQGKPFDVKISHGWNAPQSSTSVTVLWNAGVTIAAHEKIPFPEASEAAWQFQNLMSLLIGHHLSARSAAIKSEKDSSSQLKLLFAQRGKPDHPDVHPAQMLLPYELIRSEFPAIVAAWFARSNQTILAANVFFGAQLLESPIVNVKFLAVAQAAESYHRGLGTGLYMDQAAYDNAVVEVLNHIPAGIEPDHRQSLTSRLKYGNEFSLRKRLQALFNRIPDNVAARIAGNVPQFVSKVVDTRNYFTHYDDASRAGAFAARDAYVAAERLRVLVVANVLHDLGIGDDKLLTVLERSREFQHWMDQALSL